MMATVLSPRIAADRNYSNRIFAKNGASGKLPNFTAQYRDCVGYFLDH